MSWTKYNTLSLIWALITMPISLVIMYHVIANSNPDRLIWFLFWTQIPLGIAGNILVQLVSKEFKSWLIKYPMYWPTKRKLKGHYRESGNFIKIVIGQGSNLVLYGNLWLSKSGVSVLVTWLASNQYKWVRFLHIA